MNTSFLEILKYTLPALVVFLTAYLVIKDFLKHQLQEQELKLKQSDRNIILPIRLQAFERLSLLMERIDLFSLMQRMRTPEMTVAELQILLVNQIRIEFEHNLSQQIYVSNETWARVRSAKEETIMIINKIGMQLPPNIPSKEFNKKVLEYLNELDGVLPTQRCLEFLKEEAKKIY